MDMDQVQPDATATHQRPRHTDTHLYGGWLILVRIVWGALVLFILGIFIVSLPESFTALHIPCPGTSCTSTTGQLTAGDIQALQKLGPSLDAYAFYWIALNVGVALGWFLVGGVLTWRKSDDWMALLVALMLVSAGANSLASTLVFSSSIWQLPANGWYLVGSLAILFTVALFPNGRFVPRWIGWILLVYAAQLVCYLVFLRQLHLPGWSLYHSPLNALAWFGSLGVLTLAQLYRYLRVSNQVERQQTKWVAFSFFVLLVASFSNTAVENLLSIHQIGLLYVLIVSLFTCLFLVVPLSFGVAILRYRLWDIDIIINRALVYSILTVSIVGIYALVVVYLGALLQAPGNPVISLVAAGLIAVLFQPIRDRLQRGVNRLLYGQRDEPYRVITRLGQRLEATLAPDAVFSAIVETVAQALKLPYAAITLKRDQAFFVAASYGIEVETPLHVPLLYQTEQVGELLLAPRARGEAFTPADRHLLEDLARQVGVAAHAVRLTADLQLSRERLVNAREEERRRLRRDLHDGLGPALASTTLKLDAVRNLLVRDPSAADAVLIDL
ncbi:MAG TPA: GAF domain-containing protein, partial [Ktedonobacteraceae bacterium]